MSFLATTTPLRRVAPSRRAAGAAAVAVGVSLVLAVALSSAHPPAPPLIVVAGIAGIALAGLAFVRWHAAIALGLLLLAVVRFQPAPTDAVFALVIAVAALSGRFYIRRVPSVMLWLLAALLALNLVSMIDARKAGTAITFFAITLYLSVFAVWLAAYVDSRRHARQVVKWYLVAALVSAALGVLAVLAPIPGRSSLVFAGRAEGLFKDPNVFGPFLIPPLLILLEDTVTPRLLGASRRLKLLGVLLLGLGVLFSYSRAAWLDLGVGLVAMLAVLLLRRRSARATGRLLAVLFGAVVIGAATIAIAGAGSFLQERATVQHYDSSRFSAQAEGIRLGEHHPIGVGPGQVNVLLPLATHNAYVRVFAEQGPLGLLLALALLLGTLAFAARNVLRGRDTYGVGSAALLAAWCGMLVNGAVIDTLHWRHLWIVAALIWAGAARASGAGRSVEATRQTPGAAPDLRASALPAPG
jgi:hypothetical protein